MRSTPRFSVTSAIQLFMAEILANRGYDGVFVDEGRMHCVVHEDNNPSAKLWEDDEGYACGVCGYVDALEVIRVWRPDLSDFPSRLAFAHQELPICGAKVRRRRDNSHGLF